MTFDPARRRSVRLAALLVFLLCARALAGDDAGDSLADAWRARRWPDVETFARRRVKEDPDDLRARVMLAVALAHGAKTEECAAHLRALDEAGRDPDLDFPGLGIPMALVVDALWEKAWANFDPAFNRRLFGPIFEAVPESRFALVPARRLLMAALALDDEEEAARLERWFEEREREAAPERRIELRGQRLRAWLRAGKADERVLGWALEVYRAKRAFELERLGVEVPDNGDVDERTLDPAVLERLDLALDSAYDDLALAAHLTGRPEVLAFREAPTDARFSDVTAPHGLDGVKRTRVAACDVDGDGAVDLCFQGQLFVRREAKFVDATERSGLALGNGALLADQDGDGRVDILVTAAAPRLYRQTAPGPDRLPRFRDVTKAAGLEGVRAEASVEGAALFDLEGDGDLDVYLAVYENPLAVGHPDIVLRNDGGTFRDVSEEVGVRAVGPFCGRGVTVSDIDDDGDADVFVSNYRLQRNVLWRNDEGRLTDVAEQAGVAGVEQQGSFGHTIGSAFGDCDGDGDLDLFCANLAHPRFVRQGFSNLSQLLLRTGTGPDGVPHFVDVRRESGIRFQETHSDPAFVDVDNDGDLDLSLTCVYAGVPSALYANDGEGRFRPITFASGAVVFHGWGQSWFDVDGDGDLDVCYASSSGVRLLRNDLERGPHWLRVRLESRGKAVVGARVTLEAPGDPPLRLVRDVRAGRGTTSQDPPTLLFGLGDRKGRVRVTVRFPDGTVRRAAPFVNRTLVVRR